MERYRKHFSQRRVAGPVHLAQSAAAKAHRTRVSVTFQHPTLRPLGSKRWATSLKPLELRHNRSGSPPPVRPTVVKSTQVIVEQ